MNTRELAMQLAIEYCKTKTGMDLILVAELIYKFLTETNKGNDQ